MEMCHTFLGGGEMKPCPSFFLTASLPRGPCAACDTQVFREPLRSAGFAAVKCEQQAVGSGGHPKPPKSKGQCWNPVFGAQSHQKHAGEFVVL